MRKGFLIAAAAASLLFLCLMDAGGQAATADRPGQNGVGDSVDHPPPLANLSGEFKGKPIEAAMRKVGDWELERSRSYFSQDWTFAALYAGLMAAATTLPDTQ